MAEFTGGRRLVVVPSDPIDAYVRKGRGALLQDYYNPGGYFSEVIVLSPYEQGNRREFGMEIRQVSPGNFRTALAALKPDLLRAYGGYWPADLVGYNRVWAIPTVVSVHDSNPASIHSSLRYADMVLCMSQVVRQAVLAKGVDPARIRVMPNRVNLDRFRPIPLTPPGVGPQGRFPKGFKYVLHVGRKSVEKNIETLVHALAMLPAEFAAVFVGQGDALPYLRLAQSLGVAERCHWVDMVANDQLPLWYSWCDCFCVPSLWEGFGLVFIEAAACGAVIVTSDISPMNEYLSDGRSAVLVRHYRDPAAIARGIEAACNNQELRQRLKAGSVAAARPFAQPVVDRQEMALYDEALTLALRRGGWRYARDRMLWRLASTTLAGRVRGAVGRFGRATRSLCGQ